MSDFSSFLTNFAWLVILLILWTLIWKGIALWKAAKNDSLPWFIILLVLNTLGLLEIIYICFVKSKSATKEIKKETPLPLEPQA